MVMRLLFDFSPLLQFQLEWHPDGETFVTATTAPRLRMGNGFKVWHYSGALFHETNWPEGQELLEVLWQKYNEGTYKEKPISNVKVQGIQSSQPQASKAVYIPPNARPGGAMAYSPRSIEARGPIPGIPINYKTSQSQMKKQRNARRKGGPNVDDAATVVTATTNGTSPANNSNSHHGPVRSNGDNQHYQQQQQHHERQPNNDQREPRRRPNNRPRNNSNASPAAAITTGDPEKDKRVKVVQKKLKEIATLKVRKEKGENLEANQVSKINMEGELTQELSTLKIKA